MPRPNAPIVEFPGLKTTSINTTQSQPGDARKVQFPTDSVPDRQWSVDDSVTDGVPEDADAIATFGKAPLPLPGVQFPGSWLFGAGLR